MRSYLIEIWRYLREEKLPESLAVNEDLVLVDGLFMVNGCRLNILTTCGHYYCS